LQSIVAVLPARVEAAALERASRKISSSLDAYDYLLRGKYCYNLENPKPNREAEAHFDRSIELDTRFAPAYAWKACTLGQAYGQEFRPRTQELFQQSIQLVEHATSIDENDTECHRIMCRIALIQAQFAKSEHHLERALALNPNDPPVLERSSREHWEHYLWLAASYAAANEQAAAHQAGQAATKLRPQLSIGSYVDYLRLKWKRAEDTVRLCEALAQAGLSP
jgi:tetratricopeptide (TPR) repeat protein